MPRRKTIQPEPLERFDIEDAEVIVLDEATWPIGRGEHNRMAFQSRADHMLGKVFDDYTVEDTRFPADTDRRQLDLPNERKDYMASASKFARQMEMYGEVECGVDDSSLRKRIYPFVRRALAAMFTIVIERDHGACAPRPNWFTSQGTSCAQKH